MNTNTSAFSEVKGVVAVDDHVPTAGAIVWWRLSGAISYEEFRESWLDAGMSAEDLPEPCSPSTALRRALDHVSEKRLLVRPLESRNSYALVREVFADEGLLLNHQPLCEVSLDKLGRVSMNMVVGGADQEEMRRIRRNVLTSFEQHLEQLAPADVSSWLIRTLPKLDAVGLRDRGGVYFVPHSSVAKITTLARMLKSISSSGHVIHRVPAMRSSDAIEAILDAIAEEALQEAMVLERIIEAGDAGERALTTQQARCEQMDSKLARYEELLGRKTAGLHERLEKIRVALSTAILQFAEPMS